MIPEGFWEPVLQGGDEMLCEGGRERHKPNKRTNKTESSWLGHKAQSKGVRRLELSHSATIWGPQASSRINKAVGPNHLQNPLYL